MGLPHFAFLLLLCAVALGWIMRRFNFPNPITLVLGGGAMSRVVIAAIDELAKAKRAVPDLAGRIRSECAEKVAGRYRGVCSRSHRPWMRRSEQWFRGPSTAITTRGTRPWTTD